MDNKEKMVELLQHDNCPLFMVFGDKVDVLADYLIANGVTVQEWISVKDRLPEEVRVLATDGKQIYLTNGAWISGTKKGGYRIPANHGNGADVTHWMSLPQPPKGEA